MNRTYILYNPLAGNETCRSEAETLHAARVGSLVQNMREIAGYAAFFAGLDASDAIILCGGDGTLNRFANDTQSLDLPCKIYYNPVGSGNDFARDLGKNRGEMPDFPVNDYIRELPSVRVKGKSYRFLNGIGYGIDGYCCEVGDSLREKQKKAHSKKPINYTGIAIKGLLFHYKPTDAVVTVDGKQHRFHRVWLAPTMNGRYYGGGMMPTPEQERLSQPRKLSVMVFHDCGKLRALTIFPSIFQGKHIRYTKQVTVLSGQEITVEFDTPRALQIDGETVVGVSSYTASAAVAATVVS